MGRREKRRDKLRAELADIEAQEAAEVQQQEQAEARKCRLMIDFPSKAEMLRWFKDAQQAGFIPEGAGVYERDVLDTLSTSGVTSGNSYIVTNKRPYGEVKEQ